MHPQSVTVHRLVDRDGVVQVLGVGAVDGENGLVPQVQALIDIRLGDGHLGDLLCLGHYLRGELRGDTAPNDDGVGTDAGPLARAKHRLDLRQGPIPPAVLLGTDLHLIHILSAIEAARHLEVVPHCAVGGDAGAFFVHVDRAGHGALLMLYHPPDPAAGALIPLLQVGQNDLVPQERAFQGAAGDKDILAPQLGPGKGKPFRQGHNLRLDIAAPGHQFHPVVLIHGDLALIL